MLLLKTRDLDILNFIAKFGYCNETHIAKFCDLSTVQTKRIIKNLAADEYIIVNKVLANYGNYIFLSTKSGKILDTKILTKPFLNTLQHDTLLIDLYFWLQNCYQIDDKSIKTDRQIRKELGIFELNSKQRVADLLINDSIAIELEISEKPKARLQEIINSYITNESIKLVCYFLKSVALLEKILALTLDNPKFKFILFELDENNQFANLEVYTKTQRVSVDKTLLEIPAFLAKKFGNYEF